MKLKFALTCAAFALLAAACATEGAKPADKTAGGGGSCAPKCGAAVADPTVTDDDGYLALVEEYKEGKRQGEAYVPMHDIVAGWQYWELTRTQGGKTSVEKWTVANVRPRSFTAFVERDMGFYLLGYEVDLKVPRADQPVKGNVVRAFIGRKGWAPREITVGKPKADAKPASYAGAKADAFEGVTRQKKEFYGTCYTWTENGVEIKEWFADNGWFNKVIKRTEAGQTAFELSGIASERRAALDWKW